MLQLDTSMPVHDGCCWLSRLWVHNRGCGHGTLQLENAHSLTHNACCTPRAIGSLGRLGLCIFRIKKSHKVVIKVLDSVTCARKDSKSNLDTAMLASNNMPYENIFNKSSVHVLYSFLIPLIITTQKWSVLETPKSSRFSFTQYETCKCISI